MDEDDDEGLVTLYRQVEEVVTTALIPGPEEEQQDPPTETGTVPEPNVSGLDVIEEEETEREENEDEHFHSPVRRYNFRPRPVRKP